MKLRRWSWECDFGPTDERNHQSCFFGMGRSDCMTVRNSELKIAQCCCLSDWDKTTYLIGRE